MSFYYIVTYKGPEGWAGCLGMALLGNTTFQPLLSSSVAADAGSSLTTAAGLASASPDLAFFFFLVFSDVGAGVEAGPGVDSLEDPDFCSSFGGPFFCSAGLVL